MGRFVSRANWNARLLGMYQTCRYSLLDFAQDEIQRLFSVFPLTMMRRYWRLWA